MTGYAAKHCILRYYLHLRMSECSREQMALTIAKDRLCKCCDVSTWSDAIRDYMFELAEFREIAIRKGDVFSSAMFKLIFDCASDLIVGAFNRDWRDLDNGG